MFAVQADSSVGMCDRGGKVVHPVVLGILSPMLVDQASFTSFLVPLFVAGVYLTV